MYEFLRRWLSAPSCTARPIVESIAARRQAALEPALVWFLGPELMDRGFGRIY